MQTTDAKNDDVVLPLGPERLVIRQRYEALSIFNDFLIGIWFLGGSWLFFYPDRARLATWLFVIGSAQFLIRPCIRLAHRIHLQRAAPRNWDY